MINSSGLNKLQQVIDEDQFDDEVQNVTLYKGEVGSFLLKEFFERNYQPGSVLDVGCGKGDTFLEFPITHALEPNPGRLKRAKEKGKVIVRRGWLENIPFKDKQFSTALCWGTMCYARSVKEAMVEISRVLRVGGIFIFDVVVKTNLPIAYGVEINSFLRHVLLYGFTLMEQREFIGPDTRVAIALRKDEDFDFRRLLMPQMVGGKINNYLPRRDWFLS